MAALVGKFLFVSNVGIQAALPSVLQKDIVKGSEHSGCAICTLCGWPASIVGIVLLDSKTVQKARPSLSKVLI